MTFSRCVLLAALAAHPTSCGGCQSSSINTGHSSFHGGGSSTPWTGPSLPKSGSSTPQYEHAAHVPTDWSHLLDNVGRTPTDSSVSRGDGPDDPPIPVTPCTERLHEWQALHLEPRARPPAQLRCGPNGEWGGEWTAEAPAR
jgi:hypothetical protein